MGLMPVPVKNDPLGIEGRPIQQDSQDYQDLQDYGIDPTKAKIMLILEIM